MLLAFTGLVFKGGLSHPPPPLSLVCWMITSNRRTTVPCRLCLLHFTHKAALNIPSGVRDYIFACGHWNACRLGALYAC